MLKRDVNDLFLYASTLPLKEVIPNFGATIQVLDLRSWTWSRVDAKATAELDESKSLAAVTSCAGHSLVSI